MITEHLASTYDELVNTISSGVAVYRVLGEGRRGCDYVVLDFNRAALEHEGKARDEVVGKTLGELRPNIDEFGLLEVFRQVWVTGEPAFFPATVYVDDSFTNYYENRVFRLSEDRIVAVYDDVTDRMRAAEALRESEELLSEVMDSMDKAVAVYEAVDDGTDFIFVRMNKAAEPITHYRQAEVVGRRLSELFPEESSLGLVAKLREAWQTGDTVRIPLKKYEDQRIVQWVENTIFRLPSGKVVAMFEDTYAQRMAERALQESEARYRLSQRMGGVGSWEYNLQTWEFWGSDEARRIYGFKPEDTSFSTEQVESCIPERERVHQALLDLIDHEAPYDLEFDIVPIDGSPQRAISSFARLLRDENGAPLKVVGSIRDITEKRQQQRTIRELERRYEQSQKLETVGRLAGGIAHDFNNLLSVILSYTELAYDELSPDTPIAQDLLEVRHAGEKAAALTRQLLAFSRQQVLRPVPLDLNAVASGFEKMLHRILGEDIRYCQRLAPELGMIRADPGQIEQVIMNLAVNARDAMPAGGTLTLETSNVELGDALASTGPAVPPGSYVMLSVTDTGDGMDALTRARIFEPFFTTKPKGKGTGLGLSTVYGIVKQSDGDVYVVSEPGAGARFEIYLPRVTANEPATVAPVAAPVSTAGGGTILLAEDEPALRRVIARALREAGYTVLAAEDGAKALHLSAGHPGEIQLVVTDVVMPHMGGSELVERIARIRPSVKVLFMSGYTDKTIVHHGVRDEDTSFLAKPYKAADLLERVQRLLESS